MPPSLARRAKPLFLQSVGNASRFHNLLQQAGGFTKSGGEPEIVTAKRAKKDYSIHTATRQSHQFYHLE
jgi:hypothetical protein